MGKEIERKFLVNKSLFNSGTLSGVLIEQGYISNTVENQVRVRLKNGKGTLTIKSSRAGAVRKEFEYNIPAEDAKEMLGQLVGGVISKIRYTIEYKGHTWEVDEFNGNNDGLVMAEIELSDEAECFEKPVWVAEEVTYDDRYYNNNLVLNECKL